jgi:hypothetical protein
MARSISLPMVTASRQCTESKSMAESYSDAAGGHECRQGSV